MDVAISSGRSRKWLLPRLGPEHAGASAIQIRRRRGSTGRQSMRRCSRHQRGRLLLSGGRYDHPSRRAPPPSGSDCGVTIFIDHNSRRLGRRRKDVPLGTVPEGQKPGQGYQLPLKRRASFSLPASSPPTDGRAKPMARISDRLTTRGARTGVQGTGGRQGRARRVRWQAILRGAAANHNGGLLRRSDLRRQSRQGGLEDGRLPRPAAVYSTLIDEYRNKRYQVEPQSIADFS